MFLEQDLESLYTSTCIWEREFHQMVILMPLQEYLKDKLFTLYSAYENTQTLANWNLLLLAKYLSRPQGFSLKKWVGREKALASAGHVSAPTMWKAKTMRNLTASDLGWPLISLED